MWGCKDKMNSYIISYTTDEISYFLCGLKAKNNIRYDIFLILKLDFVDNLVVVN